MRGQAKTPGRPPSALTPDVREHALLLFGRLYSEFSRALSRYCQRHLPLDAAEDIVIAVWLKVWEALLHGRFEYRDRESSAKWLFNQAKWVITDFHRAQARRDCLRFVELDATVEIGDDGDCPVSETVSLDWDMSPDDEDLCVLVMEVGDGCLRNPDYRDLLWRRLMGLEIPEGWTTSRINTAWKRIKDELVKAYRAKAGAASR